MGIAGVEPRHLPWLEKLDLNVEKPPPVMALPYV
jgi:hypothetical protein